MQMKILIVDDVKANLISLRAILEEMQNRYEIIEANSGEEALEAVLNKQIDLIILDIQMPIMDGFEVAKFLKSNNLTKDIPIIFLTAAYKAEEFVSKGFSLGAVDYLTKPIDENLLINRISLYTKLFYSMQQNRVKDRLMFQQSKMASMGDMLANIAHQWRQPLSSISSLASGLALENECNVLDKEELDKKLKNIVELTQYLSKTIDDFRTFFRQDKDETTVDLQEVISKSLKIVDIMFKKDAINIEFSLEKVELKTFENELIQVLLTLLNNARDALVEQTGEKFIFITCKKEEDHIFISVKDNAGGVPVDIIDKIFEPYFTTKHQSQGTGIGLYMTNEIVVKHMKGKVNVKNVTYEYGVNKHIGAEFLLKIPHR